MGIARKYRRVIPRREKQSLTGLILERIAEAGDVFLDSFFPAKYPEARLWRKILGLDPAYEFSRPTFASILSQLKAQGLVERRRESRGSRWRVTPRGATVVAARTGALLPRPDGKQRLICFDILERERAKRKWLRGELIALGYRQLQKSVWIGETPLPSDFIASLDTLELRGWVHVLRVTADGSLGDLPKVSARAHRINF